MKPQLSNFVDPILHYSSIHRDVFEKGDRLVSKSAFIKLVAGSKYSSITLQDLKELLLYYQEMTELTGKQLNWDYKEAAFPYEIIEKEESGIHYLLLQGKNPHLYQSLILGIDESKETPQIQIVLPTHATHGDLAKANELSRFLAKQVQGELHMLNGRVMYFYKRK